MMNSKNIWRLPHSHDQLCYFVSIYAFNKRLIHVLIVYTRTMYQSVLYMYNYSETDQIWYLCISFTG